MGKENTNMRLTSRNARVDSAGTHNDRNFNLDLADHIDQSAKHKNKYITYLGDDMPMTFEELEKEFYNQHFEEYLNKKNEKAIASRHPSRVKTMEQYYKHKNSRPEDKIIQIGNRGEHVDGDVLWGCTLEYMEEFNNRYGDHCKILDMALHMDESTPHVHVRRAWIAEDEDGIEFVSQTQALKQMGIERPDMSKDEGRFNNPKMTFTEIDNTILRDICNEYGYYLPEPKKEKRPHLTTSEYIAEKERIRGELIPIITDEIREDAKEEAGEIMSDELNKYLDILLQQAAFRRFFAQIERIKAQKDIEAKIRSIGELLKNATSRATNRDYERER